jgi:hypothetical protein
MQRTVIKIADAQIARCATGRQLYVLLQTAGVRMKKRDVWPESAPNTQHTLWRMWNSHAQ